jgi:hypothetical protein
MINGGIKGKENLTSAHLEGRFTRPSVYVFSGDCCKNSAVLSSSSHLLLLWWLQHLYTGWHCEGELFFGPRSQLVFDTPQHIVEYTKKEVGGILLVVPPHVMTDELHTSFPLYENYCFTNNQFKIDSSLTKNSSTSWIYLLQLLTMWQC